MSMLDYLRRSRVSATAAYTRFVAEYSQSDAIHLFFEGDDDESFYMSFLPRYHLQGRRLMPHRCRNKEGVYSVYARIDWRVYDRTRAVFFVDKDHSDQIEEIRPVAHNIYVTDTYSIENYLVCELCLRRCIQEIFHIVLDADADQVILKAFRDALASFSGYMILIMAWVIKVRSDKLRPNLGNLNLAQAFRITDDLKIIKRVTRQECIRWLERGSGVAINAKDRAGVFEIAKDLRGLRPKAHVRGKFELWFFVEFLNRIRILADAARTEDDRHKPVRTAISAANAMEVLGPRVPEPESLRCFCTNLWE